MVWSEKDALGILKEGYKNGPSVQEVVNPYYLNMNYQSETDKMQALDLELWLPRAILLKADKMSMAHSIELRVPFLDKKVFETAKQLPENMRVDYGKSKVALRDAAISNLPEDWAKRKKLGFPVPIRHWMREEKYYKKIQSTFRQGYVNEFFNQSKLLNYIIQSNETSTNVTILEQVLDYLKDKQTKLVLYVYDSILLDYSKEDSKQVLLDIVNLIKYPVNIKQGTSYHELNKI